jgi:predicted protein tyrosine phosphatase
MTATQFKVFITNRAAIETMQTSVPHAVISIASEGDPVARLPHDSNRKAALFVTFGDVSLAEWRVDRPIVKKQARLIWQFFEETRPFIQLLVVQCEAGLSRSAAVAAALLEGSGLDSKYCYQYPRHPNPYVKMVMLRVRREMLDGKNIGKANVGNKRA